MLVDLRSDTVTKPSPAMRKAMAEAEVGDDWYGDDPTVNRLQERAAEITGKEAALYVATGTMANRVAHHVFVRAGHQVACEALSHVNNMELHSAAVLSGISYRPVAAPRGQLTADLVREALVPDPLDVRVVDLLSIENTHQIGGGTVMPIDEARAIRKTADEAGVPVYLDGARIFNASVASGTSVAEYAEHAEAMMFCLSKGLGAPIGSIICGSRELVAEARRTKILFGAAWRQAGIVAAAGLVALEEGPKRLHEDHARARRLAEGIADVSPGAIDPAGVETNMVFVEPSAVGRTAVELVGALREKGVLCNPLLGRVRFVTHLDVDDAGIERAIEAWRELAKD